MLFRSDYNASLKAGSTRRIEFRQFEAASIQLGATASIFTVLDTVIPTAVDAGELNDTVNIRKLSAPLTINLQAGDDTVNIQGGGPSGPDLLPLLTIHGGETVEKPTTDVDGGDRVILGSTRSFHSSSVNVGDAPNAIKIFGHGWEKGEELLFTSDGIAPGGLTSGTIYYAVPFGREIVRLAATREQALAASPSNENDVNLVRLTKGEGTHQLTLAVQGQPQWPTMVGSLTGDDTSPVLTYSQPGTTDQFDAATFTGI